MNATRIDRKYYALIWFVLIVATIVSETYGIYTSIIEMEALDARETLTLVLRMIFSYGAIPTAICFLFALIVYGIGARRYLLAVPRNDFIYTIMIFTAIVRFACGVVEAFCILLPRMYVVTSAILSPLLGTIAYAVMFFFVFAKHYKMNPAEKSDSFKVWGTVYLVLLGISVVLENLLYIIAVQSDTFLALVNETLANVYDIQIVKDTLQLAASIAAIALYAAFVVAAIIIGAMLKKKARDYRSPETRGEYFDTHPNNPYEMREDVGDTYGEFDGDKKEDPKDDKVFDEFDI